MSGLPHVRAHALGPACALMMVLPALVAALGGASAAPGAGAAWPPQAWQDGDLSDLSLVELALLASDLVPTTENRRELERGLAPLEEMPPEHTDAARVVLEGLAKARWHQERALRDLDDRQRAILASTDPDGPTPPGWDEVMAAVDHHELAEALLALESASTRAVGILRSLNAEPAPSLAGSLAAALGLPAPAAGSGPGLPDATAEATAALAAQVAGGLDPVEQAALADALDATPPQARAALHAILEGLLPLASPGVPADADAALVGLGAAVDEARATLLVWSTAAMAERVHHVRTGPGVVLPDADADRPPLHFGVPRLRDPDAALPQAPGLAEALREVALALGDPDTARDAETHVAPLAEALGPEARDALAQVLHQTALLVTAQRTAALVPAPPALAADPGLLSTWAGLAGGDLPLPDSPEAQALLAARPYLAAQLEAVLAREDLMTAVQDAVAALTQPRPASSPFPAVPASGHAPAPCDLERIRIPQSGPAYLHVDPCGLDDEWTEDDRALLVVDTGGDDVYEGAYGSAPLPLATVPTQGAVSSPVAIHLDLGGSDVYDADDADCALGAACATFSSLPPPAGSLSSVAVLVDWDGDDADARNEFRSGDRSQGYAGDGSLAGTGLLVERVGARSRLVSDYVAGDHSQGAAGLEHGTVSLTSFQTPGVGALLRIIGRDADAEGSFRAKDHSQGSLDLQGVMEQGAVAALVNVAGAGATSPDAYVAGKHAQGASRVQATDAMGTAAGATVALLADVVGPGGRSDDQYRAVDLSRAHGENAYFLDVLLPESVEREGLVETTVLETTDPEDLLPEEPGAPSLEPSQPTASVVVDSTGLRSSSDDTYVLLGTNAQGDGFATNVNNAPSLTVGQLVVTAQAAVPVLFLDVGGKDTYLAEAATENRNDASWVQPAPPAGNPVPVPTGIDDDRFRDEDADFFPYFLENLLVLQSQLGSSDEDPDDRHPTGRRILLDLGGRYGALDDAYALVVSLVGDTTYGTGFSSGVLLDLAGNDAHLGRTAAAAGATVDEDDLASPQRLLSFTLDLEGGDRYESAVNGSMGFGAGGAVGVLFDLRGGDRYHGVNHTQGVGVGGGLGVLVDLKGPTLEPETNRFRADGAPAQGVGTGGGVGVLVADGDHNTFDDGGSESPLLPDAVPENVRDAAGDPSAPSPDGLGRNGGGATYNGGDNAAPVVVSSDWTGSADGFALAGVPYAFTATVRDPDGDRLDVCWTFTEGLPDEGGVLPRVRRCETVEGSGTVEVEHAWLDVPTDARDTENDESREYQFELTVTDPGGLEARVDTPTPVLNGPPVLTGEAMRVPQGLRLATEYAIQLPFVPGEDAPDPDAPAVLVADWGEGVLEEPEAFNATAVDWAKSRWGARVEVPLGFPEPLGGSARSGALADAIDEDPATRVTFSHQRQQGEPLDAPATVAVWFEGARQVRQVGVDAAWSKTGSADSVRLSLDMVRPDGSTRPVGTATLDADNACDPCTWDLADFPDAAGLILRQVVPAGATAATHAFDVGDLFARGPGAVHAWASSGAYGVDYSVLDRYGGRNGVTTTLSVLSDADGAGDATAPMRLVDIGGRGAARHASLIANPAQSYGLTLESRVHAQGDEYCIDWGDSTLDCGDGNGGIPVPNGGSITRTRTWAESREGDAVELVYYPTGRPADGSGGERWPLTTVHVEQGLDLRADASTPLLFLTFEDRATWHEGLVDATGAVTPYRAIVDAGGDDRYVGRVAASIPVPTGSTGFGVPPPSLVADGAGDDAYLEVLPWGPLGSQVDPWDLDVDAPLVPFSGGNAVGWADCDMDNPPNLDAGDCVFLDTDGSGDVSAGDVVLSDVPGSDVPAGGVITSTSRSEGTPLLGGAFRPSYVDVDGSGTYSHGDVVYLDDPADGGKGRGVLGAGDVQVSGDGFGTIVASAASGTPLETASLGFCFQDTNGDGGFDGGEPVYLTTDDDCGTVRPTDVRTFLAPASGMTQAFATQFGVALLLDAAGSDVYVAHGRAQAAATRGGVAALLELGGRDVFNPLPVDHPVVAAASPRASDPWLDRPDALLDSRPLGDGPDLVQGATEDGVALLVTTGEMGVFHAGKRSQGHGTHEVASVDHYALPGAGDDCGDLQQGNPATGGGASSLAALCRLGIVGPPQEPHGNPTFYAPNVQVFPQGNPYPNGPPPGSYFCIVLGTNPGNGLPTVTQTYCRGEEGADPSSLLSFLSDGPRYGPGLGALVRLGGPALYHADSEAQGSAGSAGRGLLLDLDGGSALTAGKQAQAFSVSGTAGTVLGGSSVLRLGSDGQATLEVGQEEPGAVSGQPGPEAGLTDGMQASVLLTVGPRDATCEAGTCGRGEGQDHEAPSVRQGGPAVTVTAPTAPIDHAGTEEVLVDLPEGEDLQVVVFAVAYAEWSGGADPACAGAPLAAPALVYDDVASGDVDAVLDLGALVAGTDPLLPAGCTEVHAFARPLPQDVGGSPVSLTEWGHGSDSVLVLPPMRGLRLVGSDGFSTNGKDPVGFRVRVPEPLAAALPAPPEVGFRLTPGDVDAGFAATFQADGSIQVEWTPPPGLKGGAYVLESRTRWPGAAWSDWASVAGAGSVDSEVLVDRTPATATVDAGSAPERVRYQQDITLRGQAEDVSGVDAVVFRLLDADGDAVPLHEPCQDPRDPLFHGRFGVGAAFLACSRLGPSGSGPVEWHAAFRSSNTFQAGDLRVQLATLDGGGVVGPWQDATTVLLDSTAPRVTEVRTPEGFEAAGPSPEDGNSIVRLRVHLCDGATPEDACGAAGVDPTTVAVSAARITEDGSLERIPLERAPDLDGSDGDAVVLGYDWTSEEEIPEGTYDLFILARDQAGNLFDHNPARPFAVDRTLPALDEPGLFLPEMTRPDGEVVQQQAVKEADTLHLVVGGVESNPSTLVARIPGTDAPLAEVEASWTALGGQTLTLEVPAGADAGTGSVDVEVEATDLAGNAATRTVTVPFATPFDFLDGPHVDARSDSALVTWSLTRALDGPGDGLLATLLNEGGSPLRQAVPASSTGDASYQVRFLDLEPQRDYQVLLQAWDGANNTLDAVLPLTTFAEPVGTELQATTSTTPTYSGLVPVAGRLTAGAADVRGDLSLHVGAPDAPPAPFVVGPDPADDAEPVEGLLLDASLGERQAFTLLWDSRDHVPAGAGARTVDLHVRFDDGSTAWTDVLPLRVDNTAPVVTPVVDGPAPNGDWYNGTVVVRGAAEDDTQRVPAAPPGDRPNLRYRTAVAGGAAEETDSVTLSEDGVHQLTFTVSDGALPPNTATLPTTVRIDRTLPTLRVESGLEAPWTNQPTVPVSVQAEDAGSGLDGFRVRVDDGDWSTTTAPPTQVSLEGMADGEYWIDVEVHDGARNAQRETLNVLLDRGAPSVVDARWVGRSDDVPVLHVVAKDVLDGDADGRPSGVDAVRFATDSQSGPWSDWTETGVSGVFPVEGADGGAWLQLRDKAGNVGAPVAVEAPPTGEEPTDDGDAPSSALLGQAVVAPAEGSPETRFTFSARIRTVGGLPPDEVVLHVANQTHPMQPEGPVLEDGARIHTATVTLPPSRLDAPHTFHVTARYGDQVVSGAVEAGPTVYALGLHDPAPDDAGADAPAASLGLLVLLLSCLVLCRRRNRP